MLGALTSACSGRFFQHRQQAGVEVKDLCEMVNGIIYIHYSQMKIICQEAAVWMPINYITVIIDYSADKGQMFSVMEELLIYFPVHIACELFDLHIKEQQIQSRLTSGQGHSFGVAYVVNCVLLLSIEQNMMTEIVKIDLGS